LKGRKMKRRRKKNKKNKKRILWNMKWRNKDMRVIKR
jgi:hypothetical protein